jgi:hypothetical protein
MFYNPDEVENLSTFVHLPLGIARMADNTRIRGPDVPVVS